MGETGQCSGVAPGGRLSPERACWGMLSAPALEIYKGKKVPFGSQQLQPAQPAHAYKLILTHDYKFTGWLSSFDFGAG